MALNVISNFAANIAQRNLRAADQQATNSLNKLSSGSRVVSAKDDAASMAIGSALKAEVMAMEQATVNARQAGSLLQIADGAMANVSEILVRAKMLAVQASSGQFSSTERQMFDNEYQSLLSEINRIAITTKFAGNLLVNGTVDVEKRLNGLSYDGNENFVNHISNENGFDNIAFDEDVQSSVYRFSYNQVTRELTARSLDTATAQTVTLANRSIPEGQTEVVKFSQLGMTVTLNNLFNKTSNGFPHELGFDPTRVINNGSADVFIDQNRYIDSASVPASSDASLRIVPSRLEEEGINVIKAGAAFSRLPQLLKVDTDDNGTFYIYGTNESYNKRITLDDDLRGTNAFTAINVATVGNFTFGGGDPTANTTAEGTYRVNVTGIVDGNASAAVAVLQKLNAGSYVNVATGTTTLDASNHIQSISFSAASVSAAGFTSGVNITLATPAAANAASVASFIFAPPAADPNIDAITVVQPPKLLALDPAKVMVTVTPGATSASITMEDAESGVSQTVTTSASGAQTLTFSKLGLQVITRATFDPTKSDSRGQQAVATLSEGSQLTTSTLATIRNTTTPTYKSITEVENAETRIPPRIYGVFQREGNVYTAELRDVTISSEADRNLVATIRFISTNEARPSLDYGSIYLATLSQLVGANSSTVADSKQFNFKLGTAARDTDVLSFSVDGITTDALKLTSSSVIEENLAKAASAKVTDAILKLSTVRANVGASQNRLEFASTNLATSIENTEAARSDLLDLDVAREMTTFTSKQILMQAGVAMLAQANKMPESLLRLFPNM